MISEDIRGFFGIGRDLTCRYFKGFPVIQGNSRNLKDLRLLRLFQGSIRYLKEFHGIKLFQGISMHFYGFQGYSRYFKKL